MYSTPSNALSLSKMKPSYRDAKSMFSTFMYYIFPDTTELYSYSNMQKVLEGS